jgi:hypothetical protein
MGAFACFALHGIWDTLNSIKRQMPEKPMSNDMARAWSELAHDRKREQEGSLLSAAD